MTLTQDQIVQFAGFCGDDNPMHVDLEYAARTRFGRPVAHGVFTLALISAVLGTKIGGPGVTVVQLGLSARFLRAVYPGDTVTATCEVTRINPERRIAILDCTCVKQKGEPVLSGETTIMLDRMPFETQ